MQAYFHLAIDIGAESGRLMLGSLSSGKVELTEVHRFGNGMVNVLGNYHWNIVHIYEEICKGLEKCAKELKKQPLSIGIDTWGVDYGLLDAEGNLLGLPFAYRDGRTKNAIDEFCKIIPKQDVYSLTGTLFAPYNTLFQLFAATKQQPNQLKAANRLLFIPDLLAYFLTGKMATDFSFATTSQLYNPQTLQWESKLFDALGVPIGLMSPVVEPGTVIGHLTPELAKATGMGEIPVVAVATHDTNSAIAAIPAKEDNWAFISSGTWSLMGFESNSPIISPETLNGNFTNEGGVGHTFNVLKNHMGLWLLQQCKRSWNGFGYSYPDLVDMAGSAPAFKAFIDIDDERFLNPADMPSAIIDYCRSTNQVSSFTHAEMARIVMEGLAFKYRQTFDDISGLKQQKPDVVYITGGGINNKLLCQFTANVCGAPVKTALAEGSATGNILTQALGLGHLSSLNEMRQVVAISCEIGVYEPQEVDAWQSAYIMYLSVKK
jgi:rhamnulokinase